MNLSHIIEQIGSATDELFAFEDAHERIIDLISILEEVYDALVTIQMEADDGES